LRLGRLFGADRLAQTLLEASAQHPRSNNATPSWSIAETVRREPTDAGGAHRFLPPTRDQASLSAQVLVFPVSKREHLPAFALEERASRVPDRLGAAEDHLLAALFTEKDDLPRSSDHGYPLWVSVPSRQAHSHIR
jgi:hypothetical protein